MWLSIENFRPNFQIAGAIFDDTRVDEHVYVVAHVYPVQGL